MTGVAYKLVDETEWAAALDRGVYLGSALDQADGYIHMSTAAQLAETARRHYAGRTGLVLVEVALEPLGAALKWEPSRGGDLFPHLYAPLPTAAALEIRPLPLRPDGAPDTGDLTP